MKIILSKWRKQYFFWILVLLISHSNVLAETDFKLPFSNGEKLTYRLRWGFINVGKCILHVEGPVVFNGEPAYKFDFELKTNKFADKLFKIRDHMTSYVDLTINKTIQSFFKQNEGRRSKDISVDFDWDNNTVQYSNYGEKREPLKMTKSYFDPLAIFFYLRKQQFNLSEDILLPITDGKKLIEVNVDVFKKEKVKTPAGTFNSYIIKPENKWLGGVYKKTKKPTLSIWFSDDQKKIPVKLKSKVLVGSFKAELISID